MSERPILMNTDMVRAILEGRKTVTRRNPFQMAPGCEPVNGLYRGDKNRTCALFKVPKLLVAKPVYAPCERGDILWVRETWTRLPETPGGHFRPRGVYYYKAGEDIRPEKYRENGWHPSIHMPREAARIFLRVTGVRVERLQAITEEDAKAEGAEKMYPYTDPETGKTAFLLHENGTYRAGFSQIWDSTIPKRPSMFERYLYYWEYNPWVWVIEFERVEKPAKYDLDSEKT